MHFKKQTHHWGCITAPVLPHRGIRKPFPPTLQSSASFPSSPGSTSKSLFQFLNRRRSNLLSLLANIWEKSLGSSKKLPFFSCYCFRMDKGEREKPAGLVSQQWGSVLLIKDQRLDKNNRKKNGPVWGMSEEAESACFSDGAGHQPKTTPQSEHCQTFITMTDFMLWYSPGTLKGSQRGGGGDIPVYSHLYSSPHESLASQWVWH